MKPESLEKTIHFFKELIKDEELYLELDEREQHEIGINWLEEMGTYIMEILEKEIPDKYQEGRDYVKRQMDIEHLNKCLEQ